MANERPIICGKPGGAPSFRMVYSEISFTSGEQVVDAKDVDLNRIHAMIGCIWGATNEHVAHLSTNRAFNSEGTPTLTLHSRELQPASADATDLDTTSSVIFIGV